MGMTLPSIPDFGFNQNLWALLVSYATLGMAEYWDLSRLSWLAFAMVVILGASVVVTTIYYTYEYCVRKRVKALNERRSIIKVKYDGGLRQNIPATDAKTEDGHLRIYEGAKLVGEFPLSKVENWSFLLD
jgi:hypothetical protein